MLHSAQQDIISYTIRQLPNPTLFLNKNLEVVYASDSLIEAFDLKKRKVVGQSILDLAPNAPKQWLEVLGNCLNGVQGQKGIDRFIGSNREVFWFEYINNPWYDADENIIGILIQVTDITERVNIELEHEKTQLLLKSKSEIARIGSWEYDAINDKLHWSEMTRLIHEVPEDFEPDIAKAVEFYKEGYSRNTISLAVHKAIENGKPWIEKLQLITAKGNEVWVLAAGKPLYKNGQYIGLLGTFQDITQHSLSEQKTKESERLLRTVVDSLPLNVYIKDLESRKILVNRSEMEYLGAKNAEEVLGKTDEEFMSDTSARMSREEDLRILTHGKKFLNQETIAVSKDGTHTHFLTSKIPLRDAEDEIYGLLGISLDITELKQKEQELRELIDVTSQQNRQLLNFAHIVSHNLRSHASNFSMLLDLMDHETDPQELSRIESLLNDASENLMETLENLNEVVTINSGQPADSVKTVKLSQALSRVRSSLEGLIKDSGAQIIDAIDPGMTVQGVPAYIESILTNLLSNAIKYKHPDRQPVIRVIGSRENGKTVLSVADNGQGINLERYGEKLFGMYKTFHQHPDARGIGLYITKNQVEAMNAQIMACSEVGEGTTFKIYFSA
ncbi:PAS domain S-box-containing protein [Robiginitalea myxolifaciens]|uniref:histidine kinase n=1 Tax=Robiginitalea myxolifaciens TaxID=400055 RepID=A0A1I6FP90_9FLAO|nr:PAS domain S-box protein [Robiginitalea myxolifaciens]SFR31759.1 PAS domain S-box-containing protein [Robiginitalea myxolifaciens]